MYFTTLHAHGHGNRRPKKLPTRLAIQSPHKSPHAVQSMMISPCHIMADARFQLPQFRERERCHMIACFLLGRRLNIRRADGHASRLLPSSCRWTATLDLASRRASIVTWFTPISGVTDIFSGRRYHQRTRGCRHDAAGSQHEFLREWHEYGDDVIDEVAPRDDAAVSFLELYFLKCDAHYSSMPSTQYEATYYTDGFNF